MEREFNPHEIVWTEEMSNRFWSYYAHNEAYEGNYFSKLVGNALIDFISRYSNLKGNILDYGCGPGYLIERLLKRGIVCEGLEFSPIVVQLVNAKFSKEKNFKGVTLAKGLPTPLESNKFDLVFFIETIEHILPHELGATLQELCRVTRSGGYVFVTTSNEEYMEGSKVMCPECGCIFHRVQHVSRWSVESLPAIMKEHGFTKVICTTTRFRGEEKFSHLTHLIFLVGAKILKKKNPHLLYVGRKS